MGKFSKLHENNNSLPFSHHHFHLHSISYITFYILGNHQDVEYSTVCF